jgi:hypothetical protein
MAKESALRLTAFMRAHRRLLLVIGVAAGFMMAAWLLQSRPTDQIDSFAQCVELGYPVTDGNPQTCTAAGRTFLGPQATPTPTPEAVNTIPFRIIVSGDSHGPYPERQEVITTPTDWAHYWSAVHSGLASAPHLLPINFTTTEVVALSAGRRPTTGVNLRVTSIVPTANGTTVNVIESKPGTSCRVQSVTANPYFVIETTRLAEPVSFKVVKDVHACE